MYDCLLQPTTALAHNLKTLYWQQYFSISGYDAEGRGNRPSVYGGAGLDILFCHHIGITAVQTPNFNNVSTQSTQSMTVNISTQSTQSMTVNTIKNSEKYPISQPNQWQSTHSIPQQNRFGQIMNTLMCRHKRSLANPKWGVAVVECTCTIKCNIHCTYLAQLCEQWGNGRPRNTQRR
jgi:hypothetical protein